MGVGVGVGQVSSNSGMISLARSALALSVLGNRVGYKCGTLLMFPVFHCR